MSIAASPVLSELARHLLQHGPLRTFQTPKRIRIIFNGAYIVDTIHALYVWEQDGYPRYYVPISSINRDTCTYTTVNRLDSGAASIKRITVGNRSTDRVLVFDEELDNFKGLQALRGMLRFEFDAADAWLEEDVPVFAAPKDPFKRIDIVHSTRPIKVFLSGTKVAEATTAQHLFETGKPPKYYLPPTAVDPAILQLSDTCTRCPYKGQANYYSISIDGKVYKDIIWYYRTPTPESSLIAGHLCFYDEKVDIELDGQKLSKTD